MFDRCSSSQPPPDEACFPSASQCLDPNAQNQLGFYRENLNYQNYQQGLQQNYQQNQPQNHQQNFQQDHQQNHQQNYQQNYQQNFQQDHGQKHQQNHGQNYQQNHQQNISPSQSQFQEPPLLPNGVGSSQFPQNFFPPQPQFGQRSEFDFPGQRSEFDFPGFPQTESLQEHFNQGQNNHSSPSFVEPQVKHENQQFHQTHQHERNREEQQMQKPAQVSPDKKKRGRPSKKEPDEEQEAKAKKRNLNRFDGLSVEEVMSRTLPDVIEHNLDILIIGINPGLMSAYKGHHYPNPGNHFWKCLFLSGLTEVQLNYLHDQSLPHKYSIGFTNMVERTTPGSKDLSSKEIREGGRQLLDKLQKYKPLIAAFNGKGIYEIFCKETFGVKAKNLEFGLQPYKIPQTETVCFLMPSSSPRCAQFPRAQDKVHFYIKLKELRDHLKGTEPPREVEETQYSFDLQLAKEDAKRLAIKEEQNDPEYENCAGVSSGPANY